MSAYFEINPVFRHASYNIQAAVYVFNFKSD